MVASTVKRRARAVAPRVLKYGPLRIEGAGDRIFVDTREVRLPWRERRLLLFVVSRRGQLCLGPDLLAASGCKRRERTPVTARVNRLRRHLGRAGHMLETVRGLGYRFAPRR